jgi:hypothetical protein
MAKRLTENHPLDKKLRKLEEFLAENKMSIQFGAYGKVFMACEETDTTALYKDVEGGLADSIPYFCETKLVIED